MHSGLQFTSMIFATLVNAQTNRDRPAALTSYSSASWAKKANQIS